MEAQTLAEIAAAALGSGAIQPSQDARAGAGGASPQDVRAQVGFVFKPNQ